MATLKLTLDKRRTYRDGRSPLIIRLTSNQKSTSIHLGTKLFESEWDSKKCKILKSHPNHKELNLHLNKQLLEFEKKLLVAEVNSQTLQVAELKNLLIGKSEPYEELFIQFALKEIASLGKQKRFGTAQSYQTAINQIINYQGEKIKFADIDFSFVKGFELYLSSRGVSVNGIAVYMRALRTLLNLAINSNHYVVSNYPFKKFKIRTQKTVSRAISIDNIRAIHGYLGSDEQNKAKDIFLLIFNLIGISYMDLVLLKKSNIKGDRIIYKRRKTGKLYSIKITPMAKDILNAYTQSDSTFLLPQLGLHDCKESQIRHHVNLGLKTTNKYLKQVGNTLEIDTALTTYVARYSWANIAKANGYSKDLIAEALGHNYGNNVTGIYLEGYGNEVIDEANKSITNLIIS